MKEFAGGKGMPEVVVVAVVHTVVEIVEKMMVMGVGW